MPTFSPQTLYTYPDNVRAYKVLIAAQYSGADVKVVSEPPEFEQGMTNRTPDFIAKFPLGKVYTCIYMMMKSMNRNSFSCEQLVV